MLFGHIETEAHRVDHLRRLRELQDETGGFTGFIPFAFEPEGARPGLQGIRKASAFEELRNEFAKKKTAAVQTTSYGLSYSPQYLRQSREQK